MIKSLNVAWVAFLLLLLSTVLTGESRAQEVFEDPDGKYSVSLPTGWLGIINRDALGRNDVNIVFKVRENGSLKIRRMDAADPNSEVMEYANKDEADRIRFTPGYTKLKMEKRSWSARASMARCSLTTTRRSAPSPSLVGSTMCGRTIRRSTYFSLPGDEVRWVRSAIRPTSLPAHSERSSGVIATEGPQSPSL
jgi:hypothetical protein